MSTTTSRHAARREPRFSFLSRRKGQAPAPQAPVTSSGDAPAAIPAGPAAGPPGDETLLFRVPGTDGGPGFVIPPGSLWPAGPEDAEGALPVRSPGATLADVAVPVLRTEPADPALLRDLIDGLKALPDEPAPLPATLLRAVPRDGGEGGAKEILAGWPACSNGMRTTEAGTRVAGLSIGGDAEVLICIENPSVRWWDEFIAEAARTRDLQAYAGFRDMAAEAFPAGPAVPAEAVTAAGEGEAA